MPNKAVLGVKKDLISKRIINDIQQFFNDNDLHVNKIVKHGDESIRFYEIHFDNLETYPIDIITEKLDRYGYTPKSLHGVIFPYSFYLLVLVNKQI